MIINIVSLRVSAKQLNMAMLDFVWVLALLAHLSASQEPVCDPDMTNPHGSCDCDSQVYISNSCKSSFFCAAPDTAQGAEGCLLECQGDDQYIHYDKGTGAWECRERTPLYVCPGDYQDDCDDSLGGSGFPNDLTCDCAGQFWMSGDCTGAVLCTGVSTEDVPYPAYTFRCPTDNSALQFQHAIGHAGLFNCLDTVDTELEYLCLGAYHFGC